MRAALFLPQFGAEEKRGPPILFQKLRDGGDDGGSRPGAKVRRCGWRGPPRNVENRRGVQRSERCRIIEADEEPQSNGARGRKGEDGGEPLWPHISRAGR